METIVGFKPRNPREKTLFYAEYPDLRRVCRVFDNTSSHNRRRLARTASSFKRGKCFVCLVVCALREARVINKDPKSTSEIMA
jgi:hypothetical protein